MVTVDDLNLFSWGSQIHLSLGRHLTTSRHDPVSISWVMALHTVCTNCVEPSRHPTWHCLLLSPRHCCPSTFWLSLTVLCFTEKSHWNYRAPSMWPCLSAKPKKMPAMRNLARLTAGSCVWGPGRSAVAYLNFGERSWAWQDPFLLLFKRSFGHTTQHMDS